MSNEIEDAARHLAARFRYQFKIMTDGTILLEPPPDPNCCGMCLDAHARLS
jgi:hypothetical protein